MKIIDICESLTACGCLKHYYESKNVKDYIIFPLEMYLSIGDKIKESDYEYSSI